MRVSIIRLVKYRVLVSFLVLFPKVQQALEVFAITSGFAASNVSLIVSFASVNSLVRDRNSLLIVDHCMVSWALR